MIIRPISTNARKMDIIIVRRIKSDIIFARERKRGLIKYDIPGNINTACGRVKTLIALVILTVTYKDTLFGSKT
jgi:hypothetical protein